MILQTAQGQWVDGKNDNQWVVVDTKGNELARLPACLTDSEAMGVIRFGREFELKAFNEGVEEGLRRGSNASKVHRDHARVRIRELEEQNNTLALQLERHIIEG